MWHAVDLDDEAEVRAPGIEKVPTVPAFDASLVLQWWQAERGPDLGEVPLG
jgi:hypothetical protein